MGKTLSTKIRFPKYLIFELNFQNYKRTHQGNFQGLVNYFQMNKHHAKRFLLKEMEDLKKLKPKVKLYKIYCKPTEITEKFKNRTDLDLQDIDDLKKYITKVNRNNLATFTFNKPKNDFKFKFPR